MTSCAATTTIREAWAELEASLLAVYPYLKEPFADRPDLSPWTLHVELRAERMEDAVADLVLVEQLVEAAQRVVILEYDPSKTPVQNEEIYRRARAFNAAVAAVGPGREATADVVGGTETSRLERLLADPDASQGEIAMADRDEAESRSSREDA